MVLLELRDSDRGQRRLIGLLVVEVNVIGVGRDGEQVDSQFDGEQSRGPVFVDDRFQPLQLTADSNHWNTAAAGGDYQHVPRNQRADDIQFDDLQRLRRRDDPAIAARRVFDDVPAQAAPFLFRVASRVERTDRLGGMPHRGIVRRDHRLRDQADNRNIESGSRQFIAERLLQEISNLALAGGAAHVQRLAVGDIGCAFGAKQLRSHLRSVAVGDHQPVSQANEIDQCPGRAPGIGQLLGGRTLLTGPD